MFLSRAPAFFCLDTFRCFVCNLRDSILWDKKRRARIDRVVSRSLVPFPFLRSYVLVRSNSFAVLVRDWCPSSVEIPSVPIAICEKGLKLQFPNRPDYFMPCEVKSEMKTGQKNICFCFLKTDCTKWKTARRPCEDAPNFKTHLFHRLRRFWTYKLRVQ